MKAIPTATDVVDVSVFKTELGWFALATDEQTVLHLLIGYPSLERARGEMRKRIRYLSRRTMVERDDSAFVCELRDDLIRFASGQPVDFSVYNVAQQHLTDFQQTIVDVVRKIPRGATLSYAEVAERSGSPRAARAVGNVMANNRVPLIVPCHRVLATSGGLGGFSAPGGIAFKARLLELESGA